MAEGTATKVQKLKDETTCSKCHQQYSQPKLLPCLHSVCSSCLVVRQGVRETEGLRYMVTCPQCGAEAELPKTGIGSLPTSFFKVHMTEAYQRLAAMDGKTGGREEEREEVGRDEEGGEGRERTEEEAGQGKSCQECGKDAELVAYCRDCDHTICSACERTHRETQVLSYHQLEPLDDSKQSIRLKPESLSLPSDILHPTLLCRKHNKSLNMYCRTCSVLVCNECTTFDHVEPRHKLGFIQSLVKHQKAELKQNLVVIKEMHTSGLKAIGNAKMADEALAKKEEEICAVINESFTDLVRKLEDCRKKLVSSTQEAVAKQRAQVTQQVKPLQEKMEELANLIQVCEQTLEHANDQEFMALRRNLTTRIKELCMHWHKMSPKAEDGTQPISLPSSATYEVMSVVTAHMDAYHTPSVSKSFLSRTELEVGKSACVIVHTRYGNGKPCLERDKIDVEVCLARSGESVPATVTCAAELGVYEITFLPETRGQYKLTVKLSGKDITNSPLQLSTAPSMITWGTPTLVIENQEWPWGVACTTNREIYVTRNYHHAIAVLDRDGHLIKSIGFKGQKPGHLWSPTGITVDDHEGAIYVADGLDNGRVQKFTLNGQLLAIFTDLMRPCGVLLSKHTGQVYVCDRQNRRIVVLNRDLNFIRTFGELSQRVDEYQAIVGHLSAPHSLDEDSDGNIYVTDSDGACIVVFSPEGTHTHTIHHPHSELFGPSGICVQGDLVYVADCGENQLVVFRRNGELVNSYGNFGHLEGQFYTPLGLSIDMDGYLYVCDHCNGRIQVF